MSYVVSDLDWVLKLRLLKEYRFSNEWVKSVFEIQAYSDWGELEGGVLLLQYSKSPVGVDYIANNIMTCKWGFVIVVVRFESVKWWHHSQTVPLPLLQVQPPSGELTFGEAIPSELVWLFWKAWMFVPPKISFKTMTLPQVSWVQNLGIGRCVRRGVVVGSGTILCIVINNKSSA